MLHSWAASRLFQSKILAFFVLKLKAIESTKKRKEDTRRKILLGAMVMKLIETGYWSKEEIYKHLDEFLDKQLDRQLFGLAQPPEKAKEKRLSTDSVTSDSATLD